MIQSTEPKMNEIAEELGLAYFLSDLAGIESLLETAKQSGELPACVNLQPVAGKLSLANGLANYLSHNLVLFVGKAEADASGNRDMVNRMVNYAAAFADACNNSGYFGVPDSDYPVWAVERLLCEKARGSTNCATCGYTRNFGATGEKFPVWDISGLFGNGVVGIAMGISLKPAAGSCI